MSAISVDSYEESPLPISLEELEEQRVFWEGRECFLGSNHEPKEPKNNCSSLFRSTWENTEA